MERDLAGHTIGNRYDILGLIGRGGMGAVYRAHDRELDELVAFKVIRPDRTSPSMLQGFRQEVKLARRVTHVNVARTFELGVDGDVMYCTMELVEGESLRDRLHRDGAISIGQAVTIARAMCDGLAAAHAAGVIHRDIKPDNVLLAPDGRVVLVDFGVAALSVHDHRGFSGTLEYMAPEQLSNQAATAASDVYAVGLVLYEMLTGVRAFAGNAAEIILAKRATEKVTFDAAEILAPARIPLALQQLIGRATVQDPARRIATARDFAQELAPWLDDLEVTGRHHTQPGLETVVVFAPQPVDAAPALHLADGIHQQLLHRLVARPRLRVLPRVAGAAIPDDATLVSLAVRGTTLSVDIRPPDESSQRFDLPLDIRTINATVELITHAIVHGHATDESPAHELLLRARLAARLSFAGGDDALAMLRRAHELAPDDWAIAAELAALLSRLYLFREANFGDNGAFIAQIRERAPELAASRIAAAYLELHTGDPAVAAIEFRAAISCSPYNPAGHEGLGRMLLEAGFLQDATARLDDALAIAPDLLAVRWELARAHALEQNWMIHDKLISELGQQGRLFERMRFAWWRGDRAALAALRDRQDGAGFAPALMAHCFAVVLGERWQEHRAGVVEEARIVRSPSHRLLALKAQVAAECAGFAGDPATAIAMVELAIEHKLYDLHWYDRCPNLEVVRRAPQHNLLRAQIALRADAILDALYGDRGSTPPATE